MLKKAGWEISGGGSLILRLARPIFLGLKALVEASAAGVSANSFTARIDFEP